MVRLGFRVFWFRFLGCGDWFWFFVAAAVFKIDGGCWKGASRLTAPLAVTKREAARG